MFDIVVPTIGRSSLRALLASIAEASGPRPERLLIVDDRPDRALPLDLGDLDADLRSRLEVLGGKAAGPAAARNTGWRAARSPWIAFLDDDVVVGPTWLEDLAADLRDLPGDVAGSQARLTVPLPRHRAPTDWERNVAALATSAWITADCAYRRADLAAVGGFDERFRRAYREDADLALRVMARRKRLVRGARASVHPVRDAGWNVSLRLQAGNADDVLMDALHGSDWRVRASAPRGAYAAHARTVATLALAVLALAIGHRRTATACAAAWSAQAARFAWRRIAPGPRTAPEVAAIIATSVAIPFAAVAHRLRGHARVRALLRDRERAPRPLPRAVLFDRDGTLIADVPFNADPALVTPMPGAARALQRLREAGIATAVVTNQCGVGLGLLTQAQLDAVHERIAALVGEVGPVLACTHAPAAGCGCRKPLPGLVRAAARALGVAPHECVVIGDIGADVEAALAAGARAILVPTAATRAEEVATAPVVARDLERAIDLVLDETAERVREETAA